MVTRTIPAGEFKAKCLALMDEIAETGDELVITKRGRAVARLVAEKRHGKNEPDLTGSLLWEAEDAWDPIPWNVDPHKFDDIVASLADDPRRQ